MLLSFLLRQLIVRGSLCVIDAHGREHFFGKPGDLPASTIRLHDARLHTKLMLNPELYIGEAYMDGTLTIESGTLHDLMQVFMINLEAGHRSSFMTALKAVRRSVRWLWQFNPLARSRRNVAHHYDLSDALYESFLDKDMQYSCAYFRDADDSLEQAQLNKKRHIAAKLQLAPGMRVLDIGCGWGGMALYLAREFDVHVTGITLSREQLLKARQRAEQEGLEGKVEFHLRDYRTEQGQYDRIVSVGMFEHVGAVHYDIFFEQVKKLLKPDGVALLHHIARIDGPGAGNAWILKYIFPGGYVPALSEVMPSIERQNLWVTDIEVLRLHYAQTLAHWQKRFAAARPRIAQIYDERFCRMWEFYLAGAEMQFRHHGVMVLQFQIARDIAALPTTRDYMFERERELSTDKPLPMRRYAIH